MILSFLRLTIFALIVTAASAAEWQPAQVPALQKIEGFAWYRAWFLPNKNFFIKHERDLFRESVSVTVRGLAGAHEVFVNGQKIGAGGALPPQFSDGREINHRHKIPPGLVKEAQWNEIAFRVFNPVGEGGFTSEPPVIVTYFDECRMEGAWQFRLGDEALASAGAVADKPAAAAFEKFTLATTALGEAASFTPGPKLPPEESARRFTTADDLVIEQLLHEPLVAQPTHFTFDEHGRLWVAQYRQYPYPAGVKVLSRDQYYRSVFDKVPPAPPHHDQGRDVISIHEDTDGDGVYDRHTVFASGLNMMTSALRGSGGVWVMNAPYLLFYPDANGDDVPDGDPVVKLQGFGLEDTHSVANSLTWGPDGWLYGAQGMSTTSRIVRPGIDPPDAPGMFFEGPMVWRFHPRTQEYEIFAEGGGNLFGLEFDAQGRLFSGTNGGSTRGWHYVQGGWLGLAGGVNQGKFGPSPHPFAFGELPMMPSAQVIPRFSHCMAVVEGTALPTRYAGHLFNIDPLHSKVIDSTRAELGSSFQTSDVGDVLTSADAAFRPVFIANAPDGSIYLADLYEHYIAHGQHYQSQLDPTTGRIYRLRGRDSALERDFNLAAKTSDQLLALLAHPNKWHRQMAARLLGERRDSVEKLRGLVRTQAGQLALDALWALQQSGGLDEATAAVGLRHEYAPVRAWTVRLLGDERRIPAALFPSMQERAARDASAEVSAQLASTARRLPAVQSLPLVKALMRRDEDAADPYVPLLIWWALQESTATAPEAVLALLDDAATWDAPIVFRDLLPRLMRRFAITGKRADLLVCAKLLAAAPEKKHAQQLLAGFTEAYRGRAMTGLPDELLAAMAKSGGVPLIMRLRQGDAAALNDALALITNAKADETDRLSLIRTLGELASPAAKSKLLQLTTSSPPSVRKAALAALTSYADTDIAPQIVAALPTLPYDVRAAAFTLLTSRDESAAALLTAIESGAVSSTLVTPDIADRLRLHSDEKIKSRATKLFPAVPAANQAAVAAMIRKVEAALKTGSGSAYEGEKTFTTKCAACHQLFFKGGRIGPNLTTYQRDNLGTMLLSIVHPSAEIREGFEYQMVQTKDGRSLSGFLAERDAQVTVLRGLDGQDVTLKQDEIAEMKPMGRSLMPDGLLDDLTDQQLRDLFAFLRLSQPITK